MDSGCVTSTSHQRKSLMPAPETSNIVDGGHNHKHLFHVQAPRMVLLFVTAALLCVIFRYYSTPLQSVRYNISLPFAAGGGGGNQSRTPAVGGGGNQSTTPAVGGGGNQSTTHVKEREIDLRSILKNAAMEDNTVIITLLNKAWAEPNSVFDLFLKSFRIGYQTQRLLKHLVVITLDEHAYARCSQLHRHCYAQDTNGTDFSGEAQFMKPDYLNMVWWKLSFLRSILRLGYNFLFTDTDVLWFRDPFPHFYAGADIQFACDNFTGNASDINNFPNAGFKFVRSNNKSIEFYRLWFSGRESIPGAKTQDVLNKIKYEPFMSQLGVQIRFLDTAYFGGFCQVSKDLNKVCTMHANCCIGLDNKVFDLAIMLNDWRRYMLSKMNHMAQQNSSWSIPQRCSMESFNSSLFNHEEIGNTSTLKFLT